MKIKSKLNKSFVVLLAGGFVVFIFGILAGYNIGSMARSKISDPPVVKEPVPTTIALVKIDDHVTLDDNLRDVNFCGKIYKTKEVTIDGVDVVHRIAEIATTNSVLSDLSRGFFGGKTSITTKDQVAKQICRNIDSNALSGIITVELQDKFISHQNALLDKSSDFYPIVILGSTFDIAVPSGNIYMVDPFDGLIMGPIGRMK